MCRPEEKNRYINVEAYHFHNLVTTCRGGAYLYVSYSIINLCEHTEVEPCEKLERDVSLVWKVE